MKKILAIIAALICVLMLSSCGILNLDGLINKESDNSVDSMDKESDNSIDIKSDNPIDIMNKLEKEGYYYEFVPKYEDEAAEEILEEFNISSDGINMIIIAYEDNYYGNYYGWSDNKYMAILVCEDEKSAKNIEKDFADALDNNRTVAKAEDFFDITNAKKYESGRDGRIVYIGHDDIVEAIK